MREDRLLQVIIEKVTLLQKKMNPFTNKEVR